LQTTQAANALDLLQTSANRYQEDGSGYLPLISKGTLSV
jgi:hypothetical protein